MDRLLGRLRRRYVPMDIHHHAVRLSQSGTILHYRAAGPVTGSPIILIHGVGVTALYFEPLMRALAACGLRVLAPDLPGFGGSGLTPDRTRSTRVTCITDILAEWISEHFPGPTHLLGHSGGCQEAADLAARYPDLVRQVILASVGRGGSIWNLGRSIVGLPVGFLRESPEVDWMAATNYLKAGPRRLLEVLGAYIEEDVDTKLPLIAAPTLFIWGEHDPLAPRSYANRALHRIRDGQLVVIEGSTHCVIYHTWAETCAAIVTFLDVPMAPCIIPYTKRCILSTAETVAHVVTRLYRGGFAWMAKDLPTSQSSYIPTPELHELPLIAPKK